MEAAFPFVIFLLLTALPNVDLVLELVLFTLSVLSFILYNILLLDSSSDYRGQEGRMARLLLSASERKGGPRRRRVGWPQVTWEIMSQAGSVGSTQKKN